MARQKMAYNFVNKKAYILFSGKQDAEVEWCKAGKPGSSAHLVMPFHLYLSSLTARGCGPDNEHPGVPAIYRFSYPILATAGGY